MQLNVNERRRQDTKESASALQHGVSRLFVKIEQHF